MKKSIKNTIMIGMAAVLIGTSAITFSYAQINERHAQPHFSASQFDEKQMQGRDFNGQTPALPDGQNGKHAFDKNAQGENNQQTPPNQNEQPQGAPQQGEQPQQGAQNQADENGEGSKVSSSNTSLEYQVSEVQSVQNQNQPQNFDKSKMPERGASKFASIICYLFMAVQLAIILMIIAYLFISKFNTLSFNQVFPEKKPEQNQAQTTN